MTPVQISLLAPYRALRVVYVVLGILATFGAAAFYVKYNSIEHESEAVEQRLAATRKELESRYSKQSSDTGSNPGPRAKAQSLLQTDLNQFFAVVEGIQIEGVLLTSAEFDASAQLVLLDFGLDSVTKASKIAQELGSGYDINPWQLQSITTIVGNPTTLNLAAKAKFTGQWHKL